MIQVWLRQEQRARNITMYNSIIDSFLYFESVLYCIKVVVIFILVYKFCSTCVFFNGQEDAAVPIDINCIGKLKGPGCRF